MLDLRELRTEAMRLPEHDRASLAALLLDSLPLTAYAEEALLDAARTRYNEIATGEFEPATWDNFAALLKELGRR